MIKLMLSVSSYGSQHAYIFITEYNDGSMINAINTIKTTGFFKAA